MVEVLLFDLGDVVLTDDGGYVRDGKGSGFSDAYGMSEEDMRTAWDVAWPDFRVGKIIENVFWYNFLTATGVKNPDVEKAKNLWKGCQGEIEKMLGLLARLKPKNRLAALTNISREWLDYKIDRFGLDERFETIISSGYAGFGKPNQEIYELALQELGIKGYECAFIDNLGRNLSPAIKVGMRPILFRGQDVLEEELRSRGIEIEPIESIK